MKVIRCYLLVVIILPIRLLNKIKICICLYTLILTTIIDNLVVPIYSRSKLTTHFNLLLLIHNRF